MLPHKVNLIESLPKSDIGFSQPQANSKFFTINILKEFSDDVGLYTHEYEHVKQWYVCASLWLLGCIILYFLGYPTGAVLLMPLAVVFKGLLYTYIRPARKYMEVKAFKAQMRHYEEDHLEFFSECLSKNYNLKITQQEAKALLL